MRKLVRKFFGFSTAETNGFLILIPVMLAILFSEPLYRAWISSRPQNFLADKQHLDSLVAALEAQTEEVNLIDREIERKLFAFNPNNASKDELIELGFSGAIAARIENYRNKGGKFYIKNDLLKIYGMDSALFEDAKPYIQLPENSLKKENITADFPKENKRKISFAQFDINKADTSQLKKIYGIGEKLSVRIIKYRESLGGFVKHEQLSEVFGLDTAVISQLINRSFVEQAFQPVSININTASEQELDKHPYLNRTQAKSIVAYRFQRGKFTSVDELQNIRLLDKSTIDKITPYLTID